MKFEMSLKRFSLCAALSVATIVPLAATPLQPHRAVYDVDLASATDRSGISTMRGRMVYEFRGAECEGYTTNFRFVTQIGTRGERRVTDQQTTTFEAADGSLFRFVTKTFVDDIEDRSVEGTAMAEEGGLVVELSGPAGGTIELEKALFPTAHMLKVLERASAGERFFEQPIFDGSEDGDSIVTTSVVVGPEKDAAGDDKEATVDPILTENSYRNISIAYFNSSNATGEGTPDYRIAFKMLENGITRDLDMDYGDFALKGILTDLELLPTSDC
ncbi:MAG: cell envelope integrity EipB family protein [Pseudomonadota bacterium]